MKKNIIQFIQRKFWKMKDKSMMAVINKVLNKLSYNFRTLKTDEEETVLSLGVNLNYGKTDCFITNNKSLRILEIKNFCLNTIPELKRKEIAVYITRINQNLRIGKFDLNFENGELTYVISYAYDDLLPQSEQLFSKNLSFTFYAMEEYIPGIMNILYANSNAKNEVFKLNKVVDPTWN
jgi:hypothetical protein